MKSISVTKLKEKLDNNEDFQLIDVREPSEFDFVNIGGELVPLGQINDFTNSIERDKEVVLMCRSGKRSANAIYFLEQKHGFTNLYNLDGGILAWSKQIDPKKPQY